jgi:hypothetical protein
VTTEQLCLLQGDLASQRRFELQALVSEAVAVLCEPGTGLWALSQHAEAGLLQVIRDAAAELRILGDEDDVPF